MPEVPIGHHLARQHEVVRGDLQPKAGGASARGCHGATNFSSRAQRAAGVTSSY
jgi:hypothetical protein